MPLTSYLVSNTGAASVRANISHVALALELGSITPPSTLVTPSKTGSSNTKRDVASTVALPKAEALNVTVTFSNGKSPSFNISRRASKPTLVNVNSCSMRTRTEAHTPANCLASSSCWASTAVSHASLKLEKNSSCILVLAFS